MLRALGSRGADDARDAPEDGARRGIARFIRHPIIATISWVFVGDGDDDSDESCCGSDDENEQLAFPAREAELSARRASAEAVRAGRLPPMRASAAGVHLGTDPGAVIGSVFAAEALCETCFAKADPGRC